MDVKPGYKQTEVGIIPVDWSVRTLGSLCKITTGHKDVNEGNPAGQFPFFTCSRSVTYSDSYSFDTEAILIAGNGDVGTRHYYKGKFEAYQRTYVLDRFATNVHYMDQSLEHRLIATLSVDKIGSSIPYIKLGNLREFPIAIPATDEEVIAIAGALSDVDALIGALDRLIAKKRDLKQAAMQQLLTDQIRLPGFHGEWGVKRLGDVGACLRGVSYKGDDDLSSHDTTHTKRLLRANNVQDAAVVISDVQFVNAARVSANQVLREDDILICMANGSKTLVGKAGLFRVSDGYEYTFGAFMGCFRTNSITSNSIFVFYLLLTGQYRNYINNLLVGSSINNLRPSSIESLEFPFPGVPEQTAIAEVLSDMDAELAALTQRRDKTRALKQGMMQELLTGRIRLV